MKFKNLSDDAVKFLCACVNSLSAVTEGISDTTVATDKVFSSKHVVDLIQQFSEEDREYVNTIVANLNRLTSKVVTTIPTPDTAEANVIYLYKSGTDYTEYLLVEGNIIELGTTAINLDNYYTKTEADNKFILSTDLQGVINDLDLHKADTNVHVTTDEKDEWNAKLDKSSVLPTTSDTATDEQVYSAKAINTALDGVIKKADMSTTIDSTSTDDTVPTNKTIFNNCVRVKDLIYSYTDALTTLEEVIMSILNNTNPQQFKTGVYSGMIASTHSGGGDLGTWSGNYILTVSHNNAYGTSGIINAQSKSFSIQYSLNKWIIKRLCDTSVVDDLNLTANIGSHTLKNNKVIVKNGVVDFCVMLDLTSDIASWNTIATLPIKPLVTYKQVNLRVYRNSVGYITTDCHVGAYGELQSSYALKTGDQIVLSGMYLAEES